MRFMQGLPTVFEELRVEPDEFIASGDRVVVVGHHRGRAKGGPFDVGFAMVWQMRNGKAVSFREYNDSGKLLKAIEGQPAAV
jgi:ketosteroid isomerase-like protein